MAFFDEQTGGDAVYVLKRVPDPRKAGRYTLERRFGYHDPKRPPWRFVVPKDVDGFETDLASVPSVATWLVPKDGTHTPAALLHDALVRPGAYDGPPITREEADLVFREAMRQLDVPFLRRWMMWSAVSLATLMTPGKGRNHWYWRIAIPLVVGALLVTGFVSILDLADIHRVWTIPTALPWMGERPLLQEIAGGALAAVVAAIATPVVWGRRWRVGFVAALVVIPFAFPLAVASFWYAVYYAAETALYLVLRTRTRDAPAPKMVKRLTS